MEHMSNEKRFCPKIFYLEISKVSTNRLFQVEVQRVLGPERRVSRLEREDQLVQKAMRKKSRKVEKVFFK